MNKMLITLIGASATGKSTVGNLLSFNSNISVIDLDLVISNKYGQDIYKIFAEKGTEFFQSYTLKVLKTILKKEFMKDTFLIVGANSIQNKQIRNLLKSKSNMIIGLNASVDIIIERIKISLLSNEIHAAHPLLIFQDKFKLSKLLFGYRAIFTAFADLIIDTDNLSPNEVKNEIINLTRIENERI